jgi:transketolase
MELLNRVHAHNLVKWAKNKPEVIVFSGDLTGSTDVDLFKEAYPDRFFSMGMAEQNMLGWAGGMAREGYTPFVHTFGVFLYRRPLDQLSMSIAYPNLPVRLFGFLPGITTPGGATHQAIDDMAVLRSVPNMTLLEPGDATETESVLDVAQAVNGPVYVRMLRGEIPRLFDAAEPMVFNQARVLSTGADVTLFSSGICTEEAMRATHLLRERGLSIQHMHVSTLKPFTDPSILAAAAQANHGVVTMENHTILGGLGTCLAEVMAEAGLSQRLVRLGLPDTYAYGASRHHLMRTYDLDALALVRRLETMLETSFDITEDDLASVRLEAAASLSRAQLEAL